MTTETELLDMARSTCWLRLWDAVTCAELAAHQPSHASLGLAELSLRRYLMAAYAVATVKTALAEI